MTEKVPVTEKVTQLYNEKQYAKKHRLAQAEKTLDMFKRARGRDAASTWRNSPSSLRKRSALATSLRGLLTLMPQRASGVEG